MATIPASVTDVLLHAKESDRTERVILPITRYDNVMSAPQIVTDVDEVYGAPYLLLETQEETLTAQEIRNLCGRIV